jgi:hypothetical protein
MGVISAIASHDTVSAFNVHTAELRSIGGTVYVERILISIPRLWRFYMPEIG